ncbi:MAG: hypothetical protein AAGH60_07855 [Pseudomonadota bacterium]
MRRPDAASEDEAKRAAWRWSIGVILFIGLAPLVAAVLGEVIARIMGCQVDFPRLSQCGLSNGFFESLATWLMLNIRWALVSVPAAIVALVGLGITWTVMKQRGRA